MGGDTRECSHLWTTSTSFIEGEGLRISELMRRLLFERPCTRATPFLTSTLVMPQFIGTSAQKFRLRLYHTVVIIVVILLRLLVHLLVHLLVELPVHLLEQLFSQLSLLLLIRSLLG